MSIKEHRRIAFAANEITTADLDWAGLHSLWSAQYPGALDAGGIIDLSPRKSVLSVFVEVFDGIGDDDVPVAPGIVTVDLQPITRHRLRGSDLFEVGAVTSLAAQRRGVEIQVPAQGLTVFRVLPGSATNLPTAGALVICAHEDMLS